jgi:phosphate starvation-inducible PhoH-like protein
MHSKVDFAKRLCKTKNHSAFAKHMRSHHVKLLIGIGPAGCGKTLLSCSHAIEDLMNKSVDKIIISRPIVTLNENLGYLPGTMKQKMDPYMIPVYDSFKHYVSGQRFNDLMKNEQIELCPLAFMRGRTFDNCIVIADEVQNATPNQIKTLVTRIGSNAKLIMTGDLDQCDLNGRNGLEDFLCRFDFVSNQEDLGDFGCVRVVRFEDEDVMRSDFVKMMHVLYNNTS